MAATELHSLSFNRPIIITTTCIIRCTSTKPQASKLTEPITATTANSLIRQSVLEWDRIPLLKSRGQTLEQRCGFSGLLRAGSWSLRALRLESDCGPFVHIQGWPIKIGPIVVRALKLQPHQPHGWSGPWGCSWMITVTRRPIFCTRSTAIAFRAPDVSMATRQNMCALAKLAYFVLLCCAAWSASCSISTDRCVGYIWLCILYVSGITFHANGLSLAHERRLVPQPSWSWLSDPSRSGNKPSLVFFPHFFDAKALAIVKPPARPDGKSRMLHNMVIILARVCAGNVVS